MSSESVCDRCGGSNIVWTAPSPLWNFVIRGGSINGIEIFSVICPLCFAELAELAGIKTTGWKFMPTDIDYTPLETVTPTGRVWNPSTWLWDGPKSD